MKIDIENYDSMTPEEKVAALEARMPDMSGFVPKSALDKVASEAANYKKQLRDKQTDEEAKAAKDAEERAELIARLEQLEREKTVDGHVASYLGLGFDEKLARESAEALVKGEMGIVFANLKNHMETREKALRAELLKGTPRPTGGGADKGMSKADFVKLPLSEKQKFATENPDLYASFYKN